MKVPIIILITLVYSTAQAALVRLPRGGEVDIDLSQWDVQETKAFPDSKSLIIIHKNEKALRGVILGGTIKNTSRCPESTGKTWVTCVDSQKVAGKTSYQIFIERKLSEESIQTYAVSFNFQGTSEKPFTSFLNELQKSLVKK
jgi:hypothetical protein